MRGGTAKNALDAAFGGGEELAPRGPLRALADRGGVAAAHEQGVTVLRCYGCSRGGFKGNSSNSNPKPVHVPRDPKSALAYSKLDVVAPVGRYVEAGGHQAYEKADDQKNEPRLHGVVELIPESGVIFFESGRRC